MTTPSPGHALLRHAEIDRAVLDEHVPFFEGIGVEQELDAFARGEAALGVLGLDPALAAAGPRRRASPPTGEGFPASTIPQKPWRQADRPFLCRRCEIPLAERLSAVPVANRSRNRLAATISALLGGPALLGLRIGAPALGLEELVQLGGLGRPPRG